MRKSKGSPEMPEWMQLWASDKMASIKNPPASSGANPDTRESDAETHFAFRSDHIKRREGESELSESSNNRESNVPDPRQI